MNEDLSVSVGVTNNNNNNNNNNSNQQASNNGDSDTYCHENVNNSFFPWYESKVRNLVLSFCGWPIVNNNNNSDTAGMLDINYL